MKLEMVKIGDKYALRRTSFFFKSYFDLKSSRRFWWPKSSGYFTDCLGSLERVEASAEKLITNTTEEVIKRIK